MIGSNEKASQIKNIQHSEQLVISSDQGGGYTKSSRYPSTRYWLAAESLDRMVGQGASYCLIKHFPLYSTGSVGTRLRAGNRDSSSTFSDSEGIEMFSPGEQFLA